MKIFIILLLIINCVFAVQELSGASQKQEAINLIKQVFGVTTSDPCSSGYISCKAIDPSNVDTLYYVESLFFYQSQTSVVNIESDFTAFVNITKIHITSYYRVSPNFFSGLNKLNSLTSLFIDTHETAISDSVTIPKSLNSIKFNNLGAKLVSGFFNGNAQFLTVVNALPGYGIASTLSNDNQYLIDLEIPLTFSSGFPNNLNRLKSLQSLNLYVYNEVGTTINPSLGSFEFPTFGEFNALKTLIFDFTYDDESKIQLFNFPSSINNIKSLKELSIFKKGFKIDKSIGYLDVSSINTGLNINIEQAGDLLSSCTGRPCLVVPQNSELYTFSLDFNMTNLDLSNFTYIEISYNYFSQELPVDTIDFASIEYLKISDSAFKGKIPDEYCQIPISSMIIKFNKFTEVPSCFVCIGGAAADNIIPNKFTNFDSSTNASCPNFYVNPSYNKLADAQGDIIYIEGKDMGYSVTIEPSLNYKFETSNNKLGIVIPEGSGVGPFNYKITFNNNPSKSFDFSYGYKKPNPEFFYITSSNTLAIVGTSFSSDDSKNSLTIGGNSYTSTFTKPNLLVLDSNPASSSFDVVVTVDGQTSDKVTFTTFSKSIYIDAPANKLELAGGEVDLSGSFVVSDIKSVNVRINNVPCTVKSVSASSIKITYPPVKVGGAYVYEMIISGNHYSTLIQYKNVVYPAPPTDSNGSNDSSDSNTRYYHYNPDFLSIFLRYQQILLDIDSSSYISLIVIVIFSINNNNNNNNYNYNYNNNNNNNFNTFTLFISVLIMIGKMMEPHHGIAPAQQLNQEANIETTFYSPTFKRYESVTFYANLLNILKQYAGIVDRYQAAARRIIWGNIFQLLAQPQRPCDLLFSPVISSWLDEKSVDLMDIETYFTAFTQAQYQYPNIFLDFPPVPSAFSIPGISAPITSFRIPKSHLPNLESTFGVLQQQSSQQSFHTQNPLHKQQQQFNINQLHQIQQLQQQQQQNRLPKSPSLSNINPYQNIEILKQQQQFQLQQQLQIQQLRHQQPLFNFQQQQQQIQLQQLLQQQQQQSQLLINQLQNSSPPQPPLSYSQKNATVWSTELPSVFQQLSLLQSWSPYLQKLSPFCKELIWKTCGLFVHFTNFERSSFLVTFLRWSKDPIPNLSHITIMFSAIGYLKERGLLKIDLFYPQTNTPVFKDSPMANRNLDTGSSRGSPNSSPSHSQSYDDFNSLVDEDYDVDQYESGVVSDDEDLSPVSSSTITVQSSNSTSNSNANSPRSTNIHSLNNINAASQGLNSLVNSKKRKSTETINDLAVAAVFSDSSNNNNNKNNYNSTSSSSSPLPSPSTSPKLLLNKINSKEVDLEDKEDISKQLHTLKRLKSTESLTALANSIPDFDEKVNNKGDGNNNIQIEEIQQEDQEQEKNNKKQSEGFDTEPSAGMKKSKSMNINSILC
ncbi:hypothetical protein DICPUDRAFT_151045 [Dictyostelium purpureum]|uniref:IPT/TIG domain-containing protein n=1 Tax=Dictyostelium purpureum TaxID=5786 RepID=F0ZHV2_DICPU|nr:uncharacterized protein DICPUDRAFT_151045 [Dictyostelium purpureum]EGC36487.1 hypothetical protein DICPUDRAFT_151045 [Dictyostelium purpureum]|eukprot:XP_003287000.1 hypothetical protein DICPUDRAFT_151045 [Dictyostelium purpureum]